MLFTAYFKVKSLLPEDSGNSWLQGTHHDQAASSSTTNSS